MRKVEDEDLKIIELNLLEKFDAFCKKYGIKYFLHAGTLLGAVRHKGFIPWDDDIDVSLLREDYEKLKKIIKENPSDEFRFCDIETIKEWPYAFGKIIDTSTILIEKNRKNINIGAFIDVFPLDKLPNDDKKALKHMKKCHFYTWLLMIATAKKQTIAKKKKARFLKILITPYAKIIGRKRLIKKIDKLAKKYNLSNSNNISSCYSPAYVRIYKMEWFDESIDLEFENKYYPAPKYYDKFLKCLYKNYMELPPIEKRISNHDFVVYYKENEEN